MVKPGRYRHFKGKEYEVIGTATHSETLEEYAVYRALYGEGKLWIRPAAVISLGEAYTSAPQVFIISLR